MGVIPIHQRLAELYLYNKTRGLTDDEMKEMQHCLQANAKYCWEMAYQHNMSLMASMTNDVSWQHEICLEIDHLKMTGNKKPRKS